MMEKLGSGDHSEVYSVNVAKKVKAMKTGKNPFESLGYNKINELDITLRLRHPYINELLDFKLTNDNYIFLFPLASGTLKEIRNKKNPIKYINQLLVGLNYIHKRDIIIANIKPENILYFSNNDIVKYNDFGSSMFNDAVFKGTRRGSLAYMAPETFLENVTNRKSNIWSLGLTILFALYELNPQIDAATSSSEMFIDETPDGTGTMYKFKFINDVYLDHLKSSINKALESVTNENIRFLLENMLKTDYKDRKSVDELLKLKIFDDFRSDNEEIMKFYPGCNIRLEYLTYYNITEDEYINGYNIFYTTLNNAIANKIVELIDRDVKKFLWSVFNGIDIFNELITKNVAKESFLYYAIACIILSLKVLSFFEDELIEPIIEPIIDKEKLDKEKYNKIELNVLKSINYKVYRKNIYSYLLGNVKNIDLQKLFDYVTTVTFRGEFSDFVIKFLQQK